MSDALYGPVDDDIYRGIEAGVGKQHARFVYDLNVVAVNYADKPDQLEHLIHKWALTGSELAAAEDFIHNGPFSARRKE